MACKGVGQGPVQIVAMLLHQIDRRRHQLGQKVATAPRMDHAHAFPIQTQTQLDGVQQKTAIKLGRAFG